MKTYEKDCKVWHVSFGYGVVLSVEQDVVRVKFDILETARYIRRNFCGMRRI
ncbi:MAG: hypothetical protein IKP60_13710 [Treponema sp.]|nr:hypothetical protein [Treponema sp.]